jgi:PilZ domain
MADRTAHELAELIAHVFPSLPFDAAARPVGGGAGSQLVAVQRRDADRYLANWPVAAPMPGDDVNLVIVRDTAVYTATARVTGIDRGNARYLTIIELRRKTQRRQAPRASLDELILISDEGEVDGQLTDISAGGLGFLLDRPLAPGAAIKAVINFHGTVIPATAVVKNVTQTSDDAYRIGCALSEIADHHQHMLERYAAENAGGRRLSDGLLHRLRRTA